LGVGDGLGAVAELVEGQTHVEKIANSPVTFPLTFYLKRSTFT
jgi:hypothetical protein